MKQSITIIALLLTGALAHVVPRHEQGQAATTPYIPPKKVCSRYCSPDGAHCLDVCDDSAMVKREQVLPDCARSCYRRMYCGNPSMLKHCVQSDCRDPVDVGITIQFLQDMCPYTDWSRVEVVSSKPGDYTNDAHKNAVLEAAKADEWARVVDDWSKDYKDYKAHGGGHLEPKADLQRRDKLTVLPTVQDIECYEACLTDLIRDQPGVICDSKDLSCRCQDGHYLTKMTACGRDRCPDYAYFSLMTQSFACGAQKGHRENDENGVTNWSISYDTNCDDVLDRWMMTCRLDSPSCWKVSYDAQDEMNKNGKRDSVFTVRVPKGGMPKGAVKTFPSYFGVAVVELKSLGLKAGKNGTLGQPSTMQAAGSMGNMSSLVALQPIRPFVHVPAALNQTKTPACPKESTLNMGLLNGMLINTAGQFGFIASSGQMQFNELPKPDVIYNAGFSIVDGTLALGPGNVFWNCPTSNGHININERPVAKNCVPAFLRVVEYDASCRTPVPGHASAGKPE